LIAGLRNNYSIDFLKIRWKVVIWSTEENFGFWW